MDGILGVDKARGPTSHDVVQRVRRLLSFRRVGHAGTLDPDASGVLLVCVGRATKVSLYLMEGQKEYLATVRLGFRTATGDRVGEPVEDPRPITVSRDDISAACRRWVGEVEQIPPMVSAVKQGGVKLYQLARQGLEVDRPPRGVRIDEIEILDILLPFIRLRVCCGAGTYIRVLAEDIGELLGCGGHVFALRRARVGRVGLDQCLRWQEMELAAGNGRFRGAFMSVNKALEFLPDVRMDERDSRRIRTGMTIRRQPSGEKLGASRWLRLRDPAGDLVAIGTLAGKPDEEGASIRPVRVLSPLG
ncbi:MAG: tRNA pseudouridine(55) synthase TruB [Candidatus Eisenbacteria sp.]|nr:tRNA pseudouridine(55) synthase TruB [Candidatus Eisenbacteria bacterium]